MTAARRRFTQEFEDEPSTNRRYRARDGSPVGVGGYLPSRRAGRSWVTLGPWASARPTQVGGRRGVDRGSARLSIIQWQWGAERDIV